MSYVIGLDMGSAFVKGVLLQNDGNRHIYMEKSGRNYRETALRVRRTLTKNAGVTLKACEAVMVTGSGEQCVRFGTDKAGEMICLIRTVSEVHHGRCAILDLGGQSSRLGIMNDEGRLESFDFNEKCASGSGKVLENIARVLQLSFEQLAERAATSRQPASFTTSCAVFAESEAITAVAKGEKVEDIIAGFHQSIAKKLAAMLTKNQVTDLPILATGGMSMDSALIGTLEEMIGKSITVLDSPQHCVAQGAALLAQDKLKKAVLS